MGESPDPEVAHDQSWDDLALSAPGQLLRTQALARREAQPVRTRLQRVMGVHSDERAWRIGAAGEESVGRRLDKVTKRDRRWRFLHSIPVGKRDSDIDHVAIGPGGVFTLNTKNHPGAQVWVAHDALFVNGQRQPYVRNSRHETARAERLLSRGCGFDVSVGGVIVVCGAEKLTIKQQPDDVHVVSWFHIVRWLRKRPSTLSDAEISAIYEVARRSTTWRHRPGR